MDGIEKPGASPGPSSATASTLCYRTSLLLASFAQHAQASGQVAAIIRLMFVVEPARASYAMAQTPSFMAFERSGQAGNQPASHGPPQTAPKPMSA